LISMSHSTHARLLDDTRGLSREEAAAVEGLIFMIADADQNGSLSREEWMAAGGQ